MFQVIVHAALLLLAIAAVVNSVRNSRAIKTLLSRLEKE